MARKKRAAVSEQRAELAIRVLDALCSSSPSTVIAELAKTEQLIVISSPTTTPTLGGQGFTRNPKFKNKTAAELEAILFDGKVNPWDRIAAAERLGEPSKSSWFTKIAEGHGIEPDKFGWARYAAASRVSESTDRVNLLMELAFDKTLNSNVRREISAKINDVKRLLEICRTGDEMIRDSAARHLLRLVQDHKLLNQAVLLR